MEDWVLLTVFLLILVGEYSAVLWLPALGAALWLAVREPKSRKVLLPLLAGCLMCGQSLEKSAAAAARFLDSLFEAAQGMPPCEDGFLLEAALSHLPHFHG